MLDVVQKNVTAPPASTRPEPVARSSAPQGADAPASGASAPKGSPQITVDPVVGVIIQFLNSSGRVETQSPSFAAEAYMRAGLTADGFSKSDAEAHTQVTV
ncbi:MAG: hypothetical protein WBK91_07880 [Alphaproteobacteria bacterium]